MRRLRKEQNLHPVHGFEKVRSMEVKASSRLADLLKKHCCYKATFIIILVIASFLFFDKIETIVVVSALFTLAVLSTFYIRITQYSIGFELRTLLFVVVALKLGLVLGLVLCLLAILLSTIITFNFQPTSIITPAAYLIIALMFPLFSGFSVVVAGIIVTILYNIILAFMYKVVFGYSIAYFGPAIIGNVIINLFVFIRFGESILAFL